MLRVKMFGAVLFLAVAACATAKQQQAKTPAAQAQKDANGKTAEKEDPRIQCRMERPTGSNIPERVCKYVELKQSDEAMRTQDMMRDAQGHPGPTKGN